MEGESLDIRDGCLKKDKQEEEENYKQEKLEGNLIFTPSIFSLIVTKDKCTGWQTSHPPPYVLLAIKKNWKMCKMAPHPSPPPRKARNAIADSTLYHD